MARCSFLGICPAWCSLSFLNLWFSSRIFQNLTLVWGNSWSFLLQVILSFPLSFFSSYKSNSIYVIPFISQSLDILFSFSVYSLLCSLEVSIKISPSSEIFSSAVFTLLISPQWHPTPVLLPGKSHGWRSLVGYSPWGRWGSDTTEQLHFDFSLSCIGEGNGNPLQCSCLENPRDRGAW